MVSAEAYAKILLIIGVTKDFRVKFQIGRFSKNLLECALSLKEAVKYADTYNVLRLEKRMPGIEEVAVFGYNKVPCDIAHIPIALFMVGYELDEIKEIDWINTWEIIEDW